MLAYEDVDYLRLMQEEIHVEEMQASVACSNVFLFNIIFKLN